MQAWSHGHQLVHSHEHLTCIPWEEWQIRRSKPNEENPEEIELVISQKCMPLPSKGSRPRCVPKPASPKNATERARSGPTATYCKKVLAWKRGIHAGGKKKQQRSRYLPKASRRSQTFEAEFSFFFRLQSKGCQTAAPFCARGSPVPKAGNNHTSTKPAVGYIDPGF